MSEIRIVPRMNYWAARGLAEFHKQLRDKMQHVESMVAILLGEPEESVGSGYYGLVSDGLWDNSSIDAIVENIGAKVEE